VSDDGAGFAFFNYRQQIAQSKWKFTKAGDDWFCFAGLWRPMPRLRLSATSH
jgi:putative SOS response-associated peptidase YedK